MNFIVNTLPEETPLDHLIENDGWFPDINVSAMRKTIRADGVVTNDRLFIILENAMLLVNDMLEGWKHCQLEKGYENLAKVPAKNINKKSSYVILYCRAVYALVRAELLEGYANYDSTAHSLNDKQLAYLMAAPDEERRNAQWAIASILGQPHTTVELI